MRWRMLRETIVLFALLSIWNARAHDHARAYALHKCEVIFGSSMEGWPRACLFSAHIYSRDSHKTRLSLPGCLYMYMSTRAHAHLLHVLSKCPLDAVSYTRSNALPETITQNPQFCPLSSSTKVPKMPRTVQLRERFWSVLKTMDVMDGEKLLVRNTCVVNSSDFTLSLNICINGLTQTGLCVLLCSQFGWPR